MHLICLGVTRKLIVSLWCNGKPPNKLSSEQILNLSQLLINQSGNITSEFNRKPRSLIESKRWKVTELRQFLLYSGPVVLRNILNPDMYLNFLVLHVAVTILSNSKYLLEYIKYAQSLMEYFVKSFILYGKENVSHNVHNLLHICEDAKRFGVLDQFSSFLFENFMQLFKRYIRKPDKPLSQIIRRITEKAAVFDLNRNKSTDNFPRPVDEHNFGPLVNNIFPPQFKKLVFENFVLKINSKDNICCLKDGTIVEVRNIATHQGELKIIGKRFLNLENFYSSPCNSSEFDIYLVSNTMNNLENWKITEVAFKCIKFNYEEKFVVFPLLHLQSSQS